MGSSPSPPAVDPATSDLGSAAPAADAAPEPALFASEAGAGTIAVLLQLLLPVLIRGGDSPQLSDPLSDPSTGACVFSLSLNFPPPLLISDFLPTLSSLSLHFPPNYSSLDFLPLSFLF